MSAAGVAQAPVRRARARDHRFGNGPLQSRKALVRAALLSADAVGLLVAFAATHALLLAGGAPAAWQREAVSQSVLFLSMLPFWLFGAALYGLYRRDGERTDHSTTDDLGTLFHLVVVGTWSLALLAGLSGQGYPRPAELLLFPALALATVSLCRLSARAFCRRRLVYVQDTLVVGAGRVGQLVARKLLHHPEYGINVLGFVDDDPLAWAEADVQAHSSVLGSIDELYDLVLELDVDRVVFAFSELTDEQSLQALRRLADLDVLIDIVPRFFEMIGPQAEIHTAEGIPLIGLAPVRLSRLARTTKRAFDVAASALGLIALAPLLVLVAIAVKVDSPGPVFFPQTRVGSRGRLFRIFKFRTMVADADAHKGEVMELNRHAQPGGDPRMFKIAQDPRVTRFGRFLRRYSVDELPQLINVLVGQMSLVGPRPLILDEDQHVHGWARRRLDVKPGITGLWQVYGGSAIPFGEMVQLDYLYVRTWSLWSDIRLLLRTLPVVARGTGC